MNNTLTMFNSSVNLNLQAQLGLLNLLSNTCYLSNQLSSLNVLSQLIGTNMNEVNLRNTMVGWNLIQNQNTASLTKLSTNFSKNTVCPIPIMPNKNQNAGIIEKNSIDTGSDESFPRLMKNQFLVNNFDEKAFTKKMFDDLNLQNSRRNTECCEENQCSPVLILSPKKSLSQEFSVCDQLTTQEEEKSSEIITSGLYDVSRETSIVFNIRRYNKQTRKFVLLTRHRKLITKCEHSDSEYYAKGMCKKCYHNKGERSKFAKKCGHLDKFHYARGLCKQCYLVEYHSKRKDKTY